MIFAPIDAGLYGLYLSKHGIIVATLMAQELLSSGDDPKQILADVRDLLVEVDRVMSEGRLDDPDWKNLQIEWCLTSPFLLRHLEDAEKKLNQVFPSMKVPALVILCSVLIFLNARRMTFDLNNVLVSEKTS